MAGTGSQEGGKNLGRRRAPGGAARALLISASLLPVMGCGGFFQCQNKPACPATGTGTGTGTGSSAVNYAYVAYTTAAGSPVIAGFNLAGGAFTAIAPVTLPFLPIAMAVNPANSLLYLASVPGFGTPGVYAYSIGTGGVLTAANGGAALVTPDFVGAMTVSPDGKYLYTVQTANQTMTEYAINATGGLASKGQLAVQAVSCTLSVTTPVVPTCGVAVSPKEDFVAASLGTQGDAFFTYTSASGAASPGLANVTAGTGSGDFSVAFDDGDNAYVAQTGTLTRFSVASSGVTNEGYFTYPAGSIPRSVVVDPGSKFVYTADVGKSQIAGFTAGTVTQLAGSPFGAPASVAALGIDSTDTYLVAAGYDATAGVQLYSIASSGVLSALAKTAGTTTATQYPVLVAMTH